MRMNYAAGVSRQRPSFLARMPIIKASAQRSSLVTLNAYQVHGLAFQHSLFAYVKFDPVFFLSPRMPGHKRQYGLSSCLHTAPVASGDRSAAARMLSHPEEVLEFFSANQGLDLDTLQIVLRKLAKLSRTPETAVAVENDVRFGMLMECLEAQIEQADGRQLAQIANALALTRSNHATKKQVRRAGTVDLHNAMYVHGTKAACMHA